MRAEVQALADMGLNQMSLELFHPLVEWCVISALMFLVQMPIIFSVTFTHTPLNTHSFTRIHAFVQHCEVHNAAGD